MSNIKVQTLRSRLGLSVSVLAVLTTYAVVNSANAAPVQLDSSSGTYNLYTSTDSAIELVSGTNAYYVKNNATWAPPYDSLKLGVGDSNGNTAGISTTGSCVFSWDCGNAHSPTITVDSGAKLTFAGTTTVNQSWYFGNVELQSALIANGDVVFEYPGPVQSWGTPLIAFLGTNQFLGNVTLLDNAYVQSGYSWSMATTIFGPNTNLILGNNALLEVNQDETKPLVMGGTITGTGTLSLITGTLVINGANTAANPFLGTIKLTPPSMLVIGDGAHPSAVFGDPGHPTANTLSITGNTAGSPILRGLGTVDDLVVNAAGTVQPGYGGTLGNLTVAGYTQNATGTLKVEVSPNAVSGLHVLGNASLGGSLSVAIDPGSYATKIYNILQVDGTMTGSFTSITTKSSVAGAIAAVTKTANGYQVVTEVVQGAAATAPIVNGHLVSANRLSNTYFVDSLYDEVAVDSPRNGEQIGHNKYVWIEGFGRHSSVARNDIGYHTTSEGFTAGAEYRTEANATVGIAASYSSEDLKAKGASTAEIDTWHVAAYGGANLQYMRLDGVVFYNGYDTDTKRDLGATGVATTSPGGYAYGGSVQASLPLYSGLVTPYIRGIVSRQHLDSSVETGATLLDLRFDAINANTFVGDFGLRIDPLRSNPESKTKVLITVAIEHDFSALGENVTGLFPVDAGQSWNSYWRGDSENTAILGVDVARAVTDKLEITGRVNGRASLYQTSGEISLGARYHF